MVYHKLPNIFYKIKLPTRVWHNWKGKCWRLLDHNDTIIADKLTKELAETLMQAVNFCTPAITFTKLFVELEDVVDNRKGASTADINYRNTMYNQALEFIVKLGLIDPPPKHTDAFPMWRDQLMEIFYQKIYDIRRSHGEDDFMNIFYNIIGE